MIELAITTPPTTLLLRHESLQHLLIDSNSSSENFTDYFYDSNISIDFQNDAFMMKSFHAKYFDLRARKEVWVTTSLSSPLHLIHISLPNLPCCKFDVRVSRVHPCRVIFLHPIVLI